MDAHSIRIVHTRVEYRTVRGARQSFPASSTSRAALSCLAKYSDLPTSGCTRFLKRLWAARTCCSVVPSFSPRISKAWARFNFPGYELRRRCCSSCSLWRAYSLWRFRAACESFASCSISCMDRPAIYGGTTTLRDGPQKQMNGGKRQDTALANSILKCALDTMVNRSPGTSP
jgi:hypothetical protein